MVKKIRYVFQKYKSVDFYSKWQSLRQKRIYKLHRNWTLEDIFFIVEKYERWICPE